MSWLVVDLLCLAQLGPAKPKLELTGGVAQPVCVKWPGSGFIAARHLEP